MIYDKTSLYYTKQGPHMNWIGFPVWDIWRGKVVMILPSVINSARPTASPVANIVFFVLVCKIWKVGMDVRTYRRKDNMCENNYPYRPWLWVGRVDQYSHQKCTHTHTQRRCGTVFSSFKNFKIQIFMKSRWV